MKKNWPVEVIRGDGRWIARIIEVRGALAYGETVNEAMDRAIEIANEAQRMNGVSAPDDLISKITPENLNVDPSSR